MVEAARDTHDTLAPSKRPSVGTMVLNARDPVLTLAAMAMVLAAVAGIGPFGSTGEPATGASTTMLAHLDR